VSESILVSNPFQIHSYSDATATSGWTSSVTNSLYFSFENHQIATCRRDQSRIPSDLRCRLAESATVSCSPTVRQCYFPKSPVFLKVRGATCSRPELPAPSASAGAAALAGGSARSDGSAPERLPATGEPLSPCASCGSVVGGTC
jgi:hypothetical protein